MCGDRGNFLAAKAERREDGHHDCQEEQELSASRHGVFLP
jgi:hypothetical protein